MSEETTTYTTRHMSLNIEGCLRNYKRKKITFMEDDNGKPISDAEARKYLNECLAKGWRVIPCSSECEGFDYQNGCPGHPITKEQYEERNNPQNN
jgi:hypothetical protein